MAATHNYTLQTPCSELPQNVRKLVEEYLNKPMKVLDNDWRRYTFYSFIYYIAGYFVLKNLIVNYIKNLIINNYYTVSLGSVRYILPFNSHITTNKQ